MKLRPLYVVTGTLHVEGGDTTKVKSTPTQTRRNNAHMTVVHERTIHDDRRSGNTLATHYSRKVRNLRVLRTPWGSLLAPEQMGAFRELMAAATKDVAKFNRARKACSVVNSYLAERLSGQRLAAVEGWLMRQVREKNAAVLAARDALTAA